MVHLEALLKTTFTVVFIFLLAISNSFSQKNSFSDILNANLRSFGPIYEKNNVTGYYFFYEEKKGKSKDKKFTISILDQNLSNVGQKTIEGSYSTQLEEGTYNGDLLAFRVAEHNKKKYKLHLLDKNGTEVGKRELNYGTFDEPRYQEQMGMIGLNEQKLIPVAGKGFLYYSLDTYKGIMSKQYYTITFIPNNNSDEQTWEYSTPKSSEDYEIAGYLASSEDILLSTIVKKRKLMSKKVEYFVMGTDINTGEKLFEKKLKSSKYELLITNAQVGKENIKFFGQYYPKDSKVIKEASLGLCTFTMEMDGTTNDYKYLSWTKDFKRLLPTNKKGKINDVGYLYFHSFVKTSSGDIFAIAENYRKTISAGGTTLQVLSGGKSGSSASKVVVEDLYVLEFSSDFEIKNMKIIEKSKHDVYLPPGASFYGPQVLSLIVQSYNGFDYVFTQQEDDLFSVGYVDFEVRKKAKNGLVYGAVNYLDGELTTDKIDLSTDATELRVLPAKTGYIAIWEYFRKDKKMDIHLERINF
ncbi:MAG: hypothetical protein MI974_23370 [Chitinophagales bacterium]|nr:hypothetical protein [Chitinophagales bacterium]